MLTIEQNMRKKLKTYFFIIGAIILLVSCSDDDSNTEICPPELGNLDTAISEQIDFRARWTIYEYFENGAISITASVMDENCLLRAIMTITATPNLERQDFEITTAEFIREPTNISFNQVDEDASLGSWSIDEAEPNWVQFEEITEISVKGTFQATLVIQENGNDFHTLPDTLRFDNVSFEAVPGELLNGAD
ncbi:hypothetical protein [Costertonia aggregata]|uniref:Uncharacterized protein n=1 Tax=Costertonia aggregata TaxID=343403 RepID=A0A7H9AT61_9FLAO|nr:hypothetical protein [Costertonia aggregata]QLG46630.1 hypothetical protein HYG79_15145 [Costertonia aggregata]